MKNIHGKVAVITVLFALSIAGNGSTAEGRMEHFDEDVVIRENYGVTFHKQGILDNAHSVWHQTFVIQLNNDVISEPPLKYEGERLHRGNQSIKVGKYLCPALHAYNQHHLRLATDIKISQSNINKLLSNLEPRPKRAVLGFVGHFAKSLFGLSTQDDTDLLSKQIQHIKQLTDVNYDQVSFLSDSLQSFIIKSNQRAKLLQKAIVQNTKILNQTQSIVFETLTRSVNRLLSWINLLHMYGSQYVDTLVDIHGHLLQEEQAVQTLLQGYLPYYFLPPDELGQTLQTISNSLLKLGPFRLSHTEVRYYYHINDLTYQRVDDQLFIKMRIPLTATTTLFTVYQIHAVPIPLAANKQDRTIVEISKPYIAISYDKIFYMRLTENEYQFCTGTQLKRCNQALTMQETTNPDCLLALYNDHPKMISKLYNILFLPSTNHSESHIITVSNNSYLISSKDTHWIQTCPCGTPIQVSPCVLCIVKLPCVCALKGQSFFIPPTLHNCDYSPKPVARHLVNLAALFHFYHETEKLFNVSSKTSFAKLIYPDIPHINILVKTYNDVVGLPKHKLSLAYIAKNLKNHKSLFADKVSKLQNDLGFLSKPEISTGISVITVINCITGAIALSLSLTLYVKLLILTKTVHSFDFMNSKEEISNEYDGSFDVDVHKYMPLVILVLVFIAVASFGSLLLKLWYKLAKLVVLKHSHTTLCLTIFGNNDFVTVKLTTTSVVAQELILQRPSNTVKLSIKITGMLPSLCIAWQGIVIKSNKGHEIELPNIIHVSPLKILKM